jgi:metal-responsive CopG/Arc/MetJ family transcriptional regulator
MPRRNGKKRVGISVSLEEEILNKLDAFCEQNYNAERSAVIENAIKKFLGEVQK